MRSKRMRVSDQFGSYVNQIQAQVAKDTGKSLSTTEITSILASIRPAIQLPNGKKKKGRNSIFDF